MGRPRAACYLAPVFGWIAALFRLRLREPERAEERPEWVDEILDAIQRQSRATVKQGAKLEAVGGEVIVPSVVLFAPEGGDRGPSGA